MENTKPINSTFASRLTPVLSFAGTLVFYLSILFFFIAFGFRDSITGGGWYQQWMSNLNGRQIVDITFTDSLNGYAVTNRLSSTDTSFVLKTTNGGDNWFTSFAPTGYIFKRIKFINQTTGFVGGTGLLKTTTAGSSWFNVNTAPVIEDMSFLNNDTAWYVDPNSFGGGVYRTTNGGTSWTNQLNLGSSNPDHVYFYNGRIGFISETNNYIRKTTDGGTSWFIIVNGQSFRDMYFVDSLRGWYAYSSNMYKTTNGGNDWITQPLPSGGIIVTSGIYKFSNINQDTIWGAGGLVQYPNSQARGILYRTTNGGTNWLFQIPDTSINIFQYFHNKFVNRNTGWAYSPVFGIHTTNGGDTTFYTGIQQISTNIPKDFELKQNYPNPFNPRTVIPYSLKKAGYVKLYAYDILGRFTDRLVDQKQNAGEYEVDFMGKFAPSGVYFYRLEVDDKIIDTKKMVLVK